MTVAVMWPTFSLRHLDFTLFNIQRQESNTYACLGDEQRRWHTCGTQNLPLQGHQLPFEPKTTAVYNRNWTVGRVTTGITEIYSAHWKIYYRGR